jgi:hypothetical protein
LSITNELRTLGFRFDSTLERLLELELKSGFATARFSPTEEVVVRSIVLAKACDAALLFRRSTIVNVLDWQAIRSFCIPFVVPCSKTTILENPNASASVLTAGDVRILEVSEITTNEQLSEASPAKLATTIEGKVERSAPRFHFEKEDFISLQMRIELWKLQAHLLRNHQQLQTTGA